MKLSTDFGPFGVTLRRDDRKEFLQQVLVGKVLGTCREDLSVAPLVHEVTYLKPCCVACLHAHGCARRPEHTPWVLKPGEFCKLLLSTDKAPTLITRHLIYLEQARHQDCSLLRERRWARKMSISPHACLVSILVLKPMNDSISCGDLEARLEEGTLASIR